MSFLFLSAILIFGYNCKHDFGGQSIHLFIHPPELQVASSSQISVDDLNLGVENRKNYIFNFSQKIECTRNCMFLQRFCTDKGNRNSPSSSKLHTTSEFILLYTNDGKVWISCLPEFILLYANFGSHVCQSSYFCTPMIEKYGTHLLSRIPSFLIFSLPHYCFRSDLILSL